MATPSAKERKYDRQLRLWAAEGQAALENAHVCLLGATPTGCEIAKNIILPGLGSLTLVDSASVSEEDTASNFFVNIESIGSPRAMVTAQFLGELNPDAKVDGVVKDPAELVGSEEASFWTQYDLVIACELPLSTVEALSRLLFSKNIPLLATDTVGFYGYMTLSVQEHTIIETHPDSLVELRLDNPWPELVDFCNLYDLENLSPADHAHVPYVVLLQIYLKQWRDLHDGKLPQTYDEKKQFKQMIMSHQPNDDPENYEQTVANVWRLAQRSGVPPDSVLAITNDPKAQNVSSHSEPFWILAAALKRYLDHPDSKGLLPLPGVLPDMKADSKGYVALQKIYREQAHKDFARFKTIYLSILSELGLRANVISDAVAESFCKNAKFLKVVRGHPIVRDTSQLSYNYTEDSDDLFHIYVGLQAYKAFVESNGRAPGVDDSLSSEAQSILKHFDHSEVFPHTDKILEEIKRAGGSQLHNIASFLGGTGAQEVIKAITHQYIMMDGTMVYDGIGGKTAVLRFSN
uniref:NEDD8-activating enzyme E1 regulatory subunit n=1 Tax=Blastobotrys adeninivorans TaxID=409370 RepID=A0A060SZD4_BLAAD